LSPAPIEFPVEGLSDGVVRLRLMADADVDTVVAAVQDPEIARRTTIPSPYGIDEAHQWLRTSAAGLAAGTDLATLIVDVEDGRLLGATGIHGLNPETGRCSGGYWVVAGERGRGVAARGLTLLCSYAFAELGAQRIELWIEPDNGASLAVAERVGFQREGLLRSYAQVAGTRRDMLMYSLLPEDLPAVDV
jgi:[ribosomal protein S5]-alanine N-acetyltransferase